MAAPTSSFTEISGGITAPAGFLAGSIFCGIKPANTSRPDLALIYSPTPAVVAGTFTTNKVRAAPVRVSAAHLRAQDVRAIVANAGNANACTGADGIGMEGVTEWKGSNGRGHVKWKGSRQMEGVSKWKGSVNNS